MEESMLSLGVVFALIFIGFILLVIFFRFIPVGLWITAWASGVPVSFLTLFGMRFRKVNPSHIVNPLINASQGGPRPRDQRAGGALSLRRQRAAGGERADLGRQGGHPARPSSRPPRSTWPAATCSRRCR